MNTPSIAYMLVSLCCYQTNIDNYAAKLNLQCPPIFQRTNIVDFQVFGGSERLEGVLRTPDYLFGFGRFGHLDAIRKLHTRESQMYVRDYQNQLAQQYCDLSPKGAYALAARWISLLGVDTMALDKKFHHHVDYPELDEPTTVIGPTGKKLKTKIVPEFIVTWGKTGSKNLKGLVYEAHVVIDGPSKQLTLLTVDDASLFKDRGVEIPALVLQDLPDAPFLPLWNDLSLNATNVFGILHTSKAYQWVMTSRMLAQANRAIVALKLPTGGGLTINDLQESFVVPPQLGYGAYICGKGVAFQFDLNGCIKYVFYAPAGEIEAPAPTLPYYEEMAHKPMLVDSNSVVALAAGWLKNLQLNVDALNQARGPVVSRYMYRHGHPSHIWWVVWLKRDDPQQTVSVVVDGATGLLNRIRISGPSFSGGPTIAVKKATELMNISDDEFEAYSTADRNNLIARFSK